MGDSKCCGRNRGGQGGGSALSVQFQRRLKIGHAELVISEKNLMGDGCIVFLSGKVCRVDGECPNQAGRAPCIFDGQQGELSV